MFANGIVHGRRARQERERAREREREREDTSASMLVTSQGVLMPCTGYTAMQAGFNADTFLVVRGLLVHLVEAKLYTLFHEP